MNKKRKQKQKQKQMDHLRYCKYFNLGFCRTTLIIITMKVRKFCYNFFFFPFMWLLFIFNITKNKLESIKSNKQLTGLIYLFQFISIYLSFIYYLYYLFIEVELRKLKFHPLHKQQYFEFLDRLQYPLDNLLLIVSCIFLLD